MAGLMPRPSSPSSSCRCSSSCSPSGDCSNAAPPPRSRTRSNARALLRTRRFSTRIMRHILTSSLVLLLAACSTQPPYERPQVELPAAWKEAAPRFAEEGRWWRIYRDQDLDKVIEEAFAGNADLVIAAARVDEVRALVAEAESFFFPRVDAQASGSRQQISTRTATSFPGIPRQYSDYRATLNLSYEVDLFGRLRAGAQAARADLAADEAAREAVRLALAAQVAQAYFALRALDEQVELTRRTVLLREGALGEQRMRRDAGVISEFDLRQLEAETAAVRAQLPPLQRDREREEAALSALLGRTAKQVFESSITVRLSFDEQPEARVVPSGLPSAPLLPPPQ